MRGLTIGRTGAHDGHTETDITKYPRRPLVLGDKWDF